MMRNDSASIISSLQMDYGDSDEEETDSKNNSRNEAEEDQISNATDVIKSEAEDTRDSEAASEYDRSGQKYASDNEGDTRSDMDERKKEPEISPAELISDDEDGEHPESRQHHHRHHKSSPDKDVTRSQIFSEALNADSPSSQGSTKPSKKATRLVSYGPDEDVDEEESSSEEEEVQESEETSPELTAADASSLSRSVQNMASEDIQIPPEPPGKCSYQIQKKIEDMYERMRREGLDLNRSIQNRKIFRNPSIYEKLIDFCHIDEKGTNFPPEIYDPHIWGKESFYDELDKAQRKDMERREKEKKERTKIEFMTGTKKAAPSSDSGSGPTDEKKRKTKWDAQPLGMIHVSKLPTAGQNPGVVNLTSMPTGTKPTIIPAVGSLSKKPSSSSSGK